MSDNTDRWKVDGDCSKCRRESYCKKPCTARIKAGRRAIWSAAGEALLTYMHKERKGADDGEMA